MEKISKSDEQWRLELDPESYDVLREKGTERPFTGKYDHFFEEGTYVCKACGTPLFSSQNKFDSGCGWPSYNDAIAKSVIETKTDYSHGMTRTEITCANCGSHLGHVFEDGTESNGIAILCEFSFVGFQEEGEMIF